MAPEHIPRARRAASRIVAVSRLRVLSRAFYRRSPEEVARDLLGRWLVRDVAGERLIVRLVEVEAYLGADDPAAHTFRGRRTARVRSMYLGGGHAYVYFTYGMHHCLNVVCGEIDSGTAVLLRAAEPVEGEATLRANRGLAVGAAAVVIAGGPARLCQALGVDRRLDGVALLRGELRLVAGDPVADGEVVRGPRIGVDYAGAAASWPLRFAVRGSPALSRPL
jgi:DNA-3-methyladenine glycosylase